MDAVIPIGLVEHGGDAAACPWAQAEECGVEVAEAVEAVEGLG